MLKVSEQEILSAMEITGWFAEYAYKNNVPFFELFEKWYKTNKSFQLKWRLCVLSAAILHGYRGTANCGWEKYPVTIEELKSFIPYVYDRVKRKLPLYGVEGAKEFAYGYFRIRTLFTSSSRYYRAATKMDFYSIR